MLKGTHLLSLEGAKAKTIELPNSRTENVGPFVKKSLRSHKRKMERVKEMKPEINYDTRSVDRADQMLFHYPRYK